MEAAQDNERAPALEGTVVMSEVTGVAEDHLLVRLENDAQGFLPKSDLARRGEELVSPQIGDRFFVFVDHAQDGRFTVSKEKADRLVALERIERAFKAGETLEGEVVGDMPGGFAVDLGVKAFLPASQVGLRISKDTDQVLGQRLTFKIIRYDRGRTNVVVSRRALLEAERDRTLERLRVGSIVEGTVVRFAEFGAFVDLGTIEGLLHLSDMSWGRLEHPSQAVQLGQQLTVKVLRFDKKEKKLSLGLRQLEDDPWVHAKDKYKNGTKVRGLVVSKTDYGCFLEVEPGLKGLIHSTGPLATDAAKERIRRLDIGDEAEATVVDLDLTTRRLSLTLEASPS